MDESQGADTLPSWRAGAVKDALNDFLRAARHMSSEQRTAMISHDGVLLCEKPSTVLSSFYGNELRAAVAARPDLAQRADYHLLLEGSPDGPDGFGLRRMANAVVSISGKMTPEEYAGRVRHFCAAYQHPELGMGVRNLVYRPMLELVETLKAHDFTVFIVAHIGVKFTRSISADLYGVPPENVLGALMDYDYEPLPGGFELVRAGEIRTVGGEHSELREIVSQTGRRPTLCVVKLPGGRDLLEYTLDASSRALALSIVHDDDAREYAYAVPESIWSAARGRDPREPASRRAAVSMRDDWLTVFDTSL